MIPHQLKEQEGDTFANMIELFELQVLNPEQQFDIINRIGQLLFQSTVMRSISSLNEEQQVQLHELLGGDSEPEAITNFLETEVVEYPIIVQEEIEAIRQELLLGGEEEGRENNNFSEEDEAQISPYAPVIDQVHNQQFHETVDKIRDKRTNALDSLGKKKRKGFGK